MPMSFSRLQNILGAILAALALLAPAAPALAGGDWNDAGVAWKPYEQGIAEARFTKKPVCLVIYTEWCPHCTAYSRVFHDAAVVELSRKFVMIRADKDQEPVVASKYAPDGQYVPRTFFLKADGTLLEQITEQRAPYRYFYDENNPASVIRSMKAVLAMPAGG